MLVYTGTKKKFGSDVADGNIARIIQEEFRKKHIASPSENEFVSWDNSLVEMNHILRDPSFDDDIQVAIEYQIPQTSKRVDFIIAGQNGLQQESVVIVELKQWQSATRTSRHGVVSAFTGGRLRAVAHPSYQAYSYAKTIENYNATVQDENIRITPCAYLHNFLSGSYGELASPLYTDIIELAPFYIKNESDKLRDFINKHVRYAPKRDLLYEIDNGRIRPSKALQDALGSMLAGNEEFVMIDEQKVVYETIRNLLEKSKKEGNKHTIIVEGGPGTGKSVVAIQLLVELVSKQKLNAQYVTKNSAPRNVYFEKLRRDDFRVGYISTLFKSSGAYYDMPENTFDCLIVDESHRLNAKTGMMQNKGENQIKEIIRSSLVSVFFIDEDQVVTTRDIGSVSEIKKWAEAMGSTVYHDESTKLVSQFRCNGSEGYIAFIDDLLGIRNTANADGFDNDYEVKLFDNPSQMRDELRAKNEASNKARMIAGYCYEWKTKKDMSDNLYDIELEGDFKAKWNFSSTQTWAIDKDSFEQVGCIHTSQGLEFDYVGIIIGKDLRYDGVKVITDAKKRAKTDQSLRGLKSKPNPELADTIIRNTYKTLLTRGQKGCYIYCEDKGLNEYIKERLAVTN